MKYLFLIIILLANVPTYAQKHDNIWLTGYDSNPNQLIFGTTIHDFSNTPPERSYQYSDLDLGRTNASISNKVGDLLFYTNGGKIFDTSHQLMENGDYMNDSAAVDYHTFLGFSITQGAIILPYPGNDSLYALFNIREALPDNEFPHFRASGLLHSVIDMSFNNNLGAVINKNQLLVKDTLSYGKITATKHANGRDWWVLVFEQDKEKFYRFLLSPNGVEMFSEQDFGLFHNGGGVGMAVFTPDGKKYIKQDLRLLPEGNTLDIYDFDRCTGELSNHIHIELGDTTGISGGVTVSPNSRFLYVTTRTKIYQYDLEAADFLNSKLTVAEYDGFRYFFKTHFNTPQLGPNGKIYISTPGTDQYMHRINLPNLKGIACDVEQHAIFLPTLNARSVPNFPNYRLGPLDGSPCDTLGLDNHPLAGFTWETDSLTAIFSDNSYYEPTAWQWDFAGLGADTLSNPVFAFPAEGVYPACQVVTNQYSADTTCHEVTISLLEAAFSHEADELAVTFLDESISEPFDWFWEFGDGATSDLQHPNHTYAAAGQYQVCLTVMDEWAQVSVCDSVTVDILDDVVELEEERIFKISPNPASEVAVVQVNNVNLQGDFKIIIQNIMGNVMEKIMMNGRDDAYTLDLSIYNNGVYYISLFENGEITNTQKLVILK